MDFSIHLFFCLGFLSVGSVSQTIPKCPFEDLSCYLGSYQVVIEKWAEEQTGCTLDPNSTCEWSTCTPSVCESSYAIAIFRAYYEIQSCDASFARIATEMRKKCIDCCANCDVQNFQKTQRTCSIEYSNGNNILQSILIACVVLVAIEFISFRDTKKSYQKNYMPIYTTKQVANDSLF